MNNTFTLTLKGKLSKCDDIRTELHLNTEFHRAGHGTGIWYDEKERVATMTIECEDMEDLNKVVEIVNKMM